jgi:hypothetical protein
MNTYIVREYNADGHGSIPERLHFSTHESLESARDQIKKLLGVHALRSTRKWLPDEGLEAYHMYSPSHPRASGCGGYTIEKL